MSSSDEEDDNFEEVDAGAKRFDMLLAQYYGQSETDGGDGSSSTMDDRQVFDPLNIDSPHFKADTFVQKTLSTKPLKDVITREKQINKEIKELDTQLQRLVYENYNKFITATDTIKKMKSHVESMEEEMSDLMKKMDKITDCSNTISGNLSNKRERIDKLSGVSRMLKKMQFLLDLPKTLKTCLDMKTYAGAVRNYNTANKILNQYRDLASFQSIHKDSEIVITELKTILYNRIHMRPQQDKNIKLTKKDSQKKVVKEYTKQEDLEAVQLLLQLNEPWKDIRQSYCSVRKEFIDNVSKELPSNTKNIREFIDKLNQNVIDRAIDWIQVYITAFQQYEKREREHEDFLVNWIKDMFQEVYLARAREHLVNTLTDPLEFTDTDTDLLVNDPQTSQDFRHAMFQMWTQVSSRVHILIPEAKLAERAGNLVSDTVRAYMEFEMNKLQRSLVYRMKTLAKQNPASIKQESDINDLIATVSEAVVSDVKAACGHFALLIKTEGNDQFFILKDKKRNFHTWIQRSVMRVFEDVCADMRERVHPHSHCQIYSNKEAEEASRSSDLRKKKTVSARQQIAYTPSGLLLVCRLCRDLCKDQLKKIKNHLQEQFPIGSESLFDVSDLESLHLKVCAQQYMTGYIESQGQRLNKYMRTGLESHDWLKDDVVKGVRQGVVFVVNEMSDIADFVNRVFPARVDKKKKDTTSSSFAFASNQSNQMGFERDVMKLFNKNLTTFRINPPTLDINVEVDSSLILLEMMKICLKTFNECVRMTTFGKDGFQQLQVDAQFLRVIWSKLVDKEKYITDLVDEVVDSCAQRCLEATPLDKNIVQSLVDKKIQSLEQK
jgi:hypothetical protein